MTQALLIALWAGIAALDDLGTQMLRRPLLIAPVVGIIMGNLEMSLLIGATLEVMWMGVGNVGAYSAPDMISGTAIGTALGIASGQVATGVALAVPTSLLAQQLLIVYRASIVSLNPIAHRIADTGDFSKVIRINYIPMIFVFAVRAVPTFLAVYFGAGIIDDVVAALPTFLIDGLGVASKIIPAVGIGILMMQMIHEHILWVFVLAGFTLSVYLGLSVLPVTLISLPLAYLYDLAVLKGNQSHVDINEEDYDL